MIFNTEVKWAVCCISLHTRTDLSVATSIISRYIESPSMKHQPAAVKVVKYLNSTSSIGLKLGAGSGNKRFAYVDANWGGKLGSGRTSISDIILLYVTAAVYFTSALHKGVTFSSTKAEYFALSEATKVIPWLRRVVE